MYIDRIFFYSRQRVGGGENRVKDQVKIRIFYFHIVYSFRPDPNMKFFMGDKIDFNFMLPGCPIILRVARLFT